MKRHFSKTYKVVSILYLGYLGVFFSIGLLVFDIPIQGIVRLLLSPVFYFTLAAMIFSGLALWEGKRWAFYLVVPANLLLLYFHAIVTLEYSASNHKALGFFIVVCLQALSIIRVYSELRVPYYSPKIRWWESNPRYRLNVPVTVKGVGDGEVKAEILDISMGGCFVKLRGDVSIDSTLLLEFELFGNPLRCEGVVVWKTLSTVTHPRGMGIKFQELNRQQKRLLKYAMRRLKRIAVFYGRNRYLMNQDEFQKRYEDLEKGGSGQDNDTPIKRAS